ncbi:MAG TPA: M13 family metallopeptidase [Cyclobacteriaceae bacterium]|nr:M13 family metallopeptidase [Cyclobacteriaceae bacterium]
MSKPIIALSFILPILFTSCSKGNKETKLPEGVGIDFANLDTTANPANDFFRFANGGWLDKSQIPADRGSWGSFYELREKTQTDVLNVLNEASKSDEYPEGSDQRKASEFFQIGMDSSLAEKAGIKPLATFFDEINSIHSKEDIQKYFTRQQHYGWDAFFDLDAVADLKKSNEMSLYISAGGIGLPDRDYYFSMDEKSKEIRRKYLEHIAKMLGLSGIDKNKAASQASAVMNIETKLAGATLKKEDKRNPDKIYNKRSVNQLAKMLPSFDWSQYLQDMGIKDADSIIVTDLDFLPAVETIISTAKLDDIKAYFRWFVINRSSEFLNHDIVKADFDFYSKYLGGIEQMRPRWRRVLATTDDALGEAMGKLYVDKHFPPEAKEKALEMVNTIKQAFAERIKNLDWMSDSTKQKALQKLSTFNVKIGYPEEWKGYAGLAVDKDPEKASYIQNVLNSNRFKFEQDLAKYGKPVDRKEWQLTPQTINAYYNPLFNEIVFPAAILQPPFYDYRADDALNYGGIGAVIGHEISHGFDDQGSKFDSEGNLKNWWSEDDLKEFQEKGKALADQFNHYGPLDSLFVNGEFTLGENIGDLGGLSVAYDGLQIHFRTHARPGLIDGFTPEQRFFLSWATIWRVKYKDETLRTLINTDPHSPGMYRAIGPLSNFDEFYKAFNVKEGDKMYRSPQQRVKIW